MTQDLATDQALITAFTANADESAFAEIVRRHGPMVYRVCLRILGDHHEAEDAAQAVFAVLVKKVGTIRKRGSLTSWLHGVARTTALYALRGRIHRRMREEEVAMHNPKGAPMVDEAYRTEILESLERALQSLSGRQLEAVALRHLEGRSINEAAAMAGCSPNVMMGRTNAGIARLRKWFAKRGIGFSSVALVSLLDSEAHAAVPNTLLPAILTTSQSVAAGAATGAVSGSVMSLTEGVMKMMTLKTASMAAACAFGAMIVVVGAMQGVSAGSKSVGTPEGIVSSTVTNMGIAMTTSLSSSTWREKAPMELRVTFKNVSDIPLCLWGSPRLAQLVFTDTRDKQSWQRSDGGQPATPDDQWWVLQQKQSTNILIRLDRIDRFCLFGPIMRDLNREAGSAKFLPAGDYELRVRYNHPQPRVPCSPTNVVVWTPRWTYPRGSGSLPAQVPPSVSFNIPARRPKR